MRMGRESLDKLREKSCRSRRTSPSLSDLRFSFTRCDPPGLKCDVVTKPSTLGRIPRSSSDDGSNVVPCSCGQAVSSSALDRLGELPWSPPAFLPLGVAEDGFFLGRDGVRDSPGRDVILVIRPRLGDTDESDTALLFLDAAPVGFLTSLVPRCFTGTALPRDNDGDGDGHGGAALLTLRAAACSMRTDGGGWYTWPRRCPSVSPRSPKPSESSECSSSIPSLASRAWSGAERSGVEWSGVEWSGVEWSGVE